MQSKEISKLETQQMAILLAVNTLPFLLFLIPLCLEQGSADRNAIPLSHANQTFFKFLGFLGPICALGSALLPFFWKEGLTSSRIWQGMTFKSNSKWMLIAFIPVIATIVASILQSHGFPRLFGGFENFGVILRQDPIYPLRIGIEFLNACLLLLSLSVVSESRSRIIGLCLLTLLPTVSTEIQSMIVWAKYPNVPSDSYFMIAAYPRVIFWWDWSWALLELFLTITLVEIFRPSLKYLFIYWITTTVLVYILQSPQGWYALTAKVVAAILVGTAWQLKLNERYAAESVDSDPLPE